MAKKDVQIRVGADVNQALASFQRMEKGVQRFSRRAGEIGRAVDGVFSPLMRGVTLAIGAITTGMAALTKVSLQVGGDFELVMKRVAGIIGDSGEAFDRLTSKARDMGEKLPISAAEAANAMLLLAQAGKKTDEILSIVDNTVALSIGQNYDLAATTQLVVSTMSMFGLKTSEAQRVTDAFTNAANNSQLTMEKLAGGMSYVGEIAKAFGLELEDTLAMLALLSRSGLDGEKMATSLRAILINLRDVTPQAAKAFSQMGISLRDAAGEMKQPAELLKELAAAGMTVDQAIQIFDRRAIGAGLNLSTFVGELEKTTQIMRTQGTTQKLLNELLDTYVNRMKEVKSAFQETLLVTFDQINTGAKSITQEVTSLIRTFNKWARETELFSAIFDGLIKGFGIVTGNAESFREVLDKIDVEAVGKKFQSFAEGAKALFTALGNIAGKIPWKFIIDNLETLTTIIFTGWAVGKVLKIVSAIGNLTDAFLGFGTFLLTNPLGIVLVGIAAALLLIAEHMDPLTEKTKKHREELRKLSVDALETEIALKKVALAQERDKPKGILGMSSAETRLTAELGFLEGALIDVKKAQEENNEEGKKSTGVSKEIEAAWAKATAEYKAGTITLDEYMAKMRELMGVAKEVKETIAPDKNATNAPFSGSYDTLAEGFDKAISETQNKIREFTSNARVAMRRFKVDSDEAGRVLKNQITDEIGAIAGKLEREFGPAIAKAFIEQLGDDAQSGGNRMVKEITDAFQKIVKTGKDLLGNANIFGEGDIGGFYSRAGMEAAREYAKKFGKPFQDAFGKEYDINFGLPTENLENKLNSLGPVGIDVGENVGKGLYDGITSWVDEAVKAAKSRIAEINVPALITNTPNLAAAVNQAGRGL